MISELDDFGDEVVRALGRAGVGQGDTVRDTVDSVLNRAKDTIRHTGDRAERFATDAQRRAGQALDFTRDAVSGNPISTVGVALLAGFILGALVLSSRSRD